jgi:hypothetical protein
MPLKEKTYIRDGFVSAGNAEVTGSLGVTGGITGSLQGTASYATQALSASWAPGGSSTPSLTSTYIAFGNGSNLLTGTSNFVVNQTYTWQSAPLVINVGGIPSNGYSQFNHFQMPYQITAFKSTTSGNPSEIQIYNDGNYVQMGVEGSSAGTRLGGTLPYNMYFGCYSNYGLTFHTNNAAAGAISSAGNWFFGGNSTASGKVHIKGSGTNLFKITNDGTVELSTGQLSFPVNAGTIYCAGELIISSSASSSSVLAVEGTLGELFTITDDLSNSLMSVNNISGLPVFEVFADDTILYGAYSVRAYTTTVKLTGINSPVSLFTIDTSLYTGVFVEYVLTDGVGNSRAGKLTVVSDGASVAYDDDFNNTSPSEIGSTSFTFNATMSSSVVSINCNTITGTYTLKAIIRAI